MKTTKKYWVLFTKRTNDPKLKWIEEELAKLGIESRRNGESWHAPILEVQLKDLPAAERMLAPIDDIPDDDPRFALDEFPMLEWLQENKDNQ